MSTHCSWRRRILTIAAASLAVIAACRGTASEPATLVLRGARVYTVDSTQPWAEAVAIRGGRIVAVGPNAAVDSLIGPSTRVLELAGRLVLPGFIDTHVHPVTSGVEMGECNLTDAPSLDSVRRIVRGCVAKATPRAWIRGGGYPITLFPGGNPTRQFLDSLVGDRAVYLTSADGHSAWVSSRALAIAGVTRATADPPNGRIERETGGGPSGSLWESATNLVSDSLPPRTDDEWFVGLKRALALAARYGITTMHEASASEPILRAYAHADSSGTLTARVVVSLRVDTDRGSEQVAELAALRQRYTRGLVRPVAAKIFADGVIEGGTAALLEPYVDRPGYRGDLNLPPARLDSLVRSLDSAGFKVHIHAIGDRAIRAALDAFERARVPRGETIIAARAASDAQDTDDTSPVSDAPAGGPAASDARRPSAVTVAQSPRATNADTRGQNPPSEGDAAGTRTSAQPRRHILAHIQLFAPGDLERFAPLGVVASFQPLWAYRDAYVRDLTEPRLGPERSKRMYPIASMVKSGAIVAAGSDWSVSTLNPLEAMQIAVTRRALDDSTGATWLADERVDLPTIVRAYTLGGAMAGDEERERGTIERGKAADLIVLSDNIFELPAHRIRTARVLLTLLGGREVYRDSALAR